MNENIFAHPIRVFHKFTTHKIPSFILFYTPPSPISHKKYLEIEKKAIKKYTQKKAADIGKK
jgi:hypothetical protein